MSAPVRHTCPAIDKTIAAIKSAMKSAADGMKYVSKGDDAYDCFWQIEYDLDGEEVRLEDLRSDNDELRKWGHELEQEINSLSNYVEELEKKLSELHPA